MGGSGSLSPYLDPCDPPILDASCVLLICAMGPMPHDASAERTHMGKENKHLWEP